MGEVEGRAELLEGELVVGVKERVHEHDGHRRDAAGAAGLELRREGGQAGGEGGGDADLLARDGGDGWGHSWGKERRQQ